MSSRFPSARCKTLGFSLKKAKKKSQRADAQGSSCGPGLYKEGDLRRRQGRPRVSYFKKKVLTFSSPRRGASCKIDDEKAK